ncbi:hypothetical protein KK083_20160 [Fulvivirgaceae bacterium PWU4]|uniref:Beta-galactosidase n=1 Tax=Chryseosolibacter histidini TaxID=2782349 RepID=A0AAP2DQN2_9BACT|nr:sugar-binding domain-containing protein [Chryseosolibacter histidini]MBT1699222.1 hypothetical protein [Chryseosolibacter histidini]
MTVLRSIIFFCLCVAGLCAVAQDDPRELVSLDGTWRFVTDPQRTGLASGWNTTLPANATDVTVPHTWNVMKAHENYRGLAWYERKLAVPSTWKDRNVRLKFAAVYRDAVIYVNGKKAGEHLNSGYTTFYVDISHLLTFGADNTVTVSVDNSFSETALPYKDSFDWCNDGGIIRNVSVIVSGKPSIRYAHAIPTINFADTSARVILKIRLWEEDVKKAGFSIAIREKRGNKTVLSKDVTLTRQGDAFVTLFDIAKVHLWHFNDPFLYQVQVTAKSKGKETDRHTASFGFRKVVLEGQKLLVNNEPVRLPGIEYMPSSHPDHGSAEPRWVMDSVVHMLKDLNTVITRFHWQVDEYMLDRYDEAGILVQAEIPWWQQPYKLTPAVMETARMQLAEMTERDFNHASIFAWGISNEVFSTDRGQYVTLRDFTKALDSTRLAVVVSNETFKRRENDESFIADLPTWNDYVGTWYGKASDELPAYFKEIEGFLGNRPLLITEAGLCEPRFSGGDLRRIDDMIYHYREWAKRDYIAGCIYFCLNDYRTHRGEDGSGRFKARIHGITDLYFNRKPSYYVYKQLASPVEIRNVKKLKDDRIEVTLANRNNLPSYTLREYKVVWLTKEGQSTEMKLPLMKPGDSLTIVLDNIQPRFDFAIVSPTGHAVTGYPLSSK